MNNNRKRPGWGVPVWLAGLLPALLMACASAPATRPKRPTSSSASQPAEEKLPEQRAFLLPVPDPLGLNEEQVEGEVMVPLACHRSGRLQGGGSCLELFSPGTPISLADGTQRRVAAGVTLLCPDDHRRTPGMVLDDKPKQEEDDWSEPPAYAVWPSSARSGVKVTQRPHPSEKPACRGWCSFGRRGHPRVRVSEERRDQLVQAAATAGAEEAAERLEVVQELVLDVDGDGSDDRIYSVVVLLPERQSYGFSFSALFLASGRRPGQMDLLYRQDSDAIVVRGTLDLDADSNRELWILFSSTDGADDAHAVLSLRRGRPAVVGRYSCRPRTD